MSQIPIIGGQHGVVYGIDGCRWWAENGLIKYEEVDGNYGAISVRSCLQRLKANNELHGRRSVDKGFHTADEVTRVQRFIQEMLELCRKAREQGTPDDPAARRDRLRRLPTTVRVPDSKTMF